MAQIFRTDNPLLGKGLSMGQRLCYLNAMLHFFYGLPRLVFLTAPLAYPVFRCQIFHASALMIIAYVLPHIFHASLTNSRIQGRFRHSFWNEVYETVLAWYIMRPGADGAGQSQVRRLQRDRQGRSDRQGSTSNGNWPGRTSCCCS